MASLSRLGMRFASTVSSESAKQAVQAANQRLGSVATRLSTLGDKVMYWGRVTKELGKEVYTKENLAPPKLTQWDSARKEFWQLFVWRNVREWKMNDVAKGAVVGVELLGLFTIGEVVGRRSLIGYNV